MGQRILWLLVGMLWLWLAPSGPARAEAAPPAEGKDRAVTAHYVINATPHCASRPGENVTFLYVMTNNSGGTVFFVVTQDLHDPEVVAVPRQETDSRVYSDAVGVPTYRLHPRGWCKPFETRQSGEAEALRATVQQLVNQIRTERTGHEQIRAMIETLEQSLLAAAESSEPAAANAFKNQIAVLESNDESHLHAIRQLQDSITSAYGQPDEADAVIAELAVHALEPDSSVVQNGFRQADPFRLIKNDDDDNKNGTPDKDESPVASERELGQVWTFFAKPVDVSATLELRSATSNLAFWKSRTKSAGDALPRVFNEMAVRYRHFMEGSQASVTYLEELLTAQFMECQDDVQGTVDGITQVDFEAEPESAPMVTGDPNYQQGRNTRPGGGDRLFPDKNTPTDLVHDRLKVKATIQPRRAGVEVFFRPFDVDDPSSDVDPVDADATQGDNHKDNRGEVVVGAEKYKQGRLDDAGDKGIASAFTDGDGGAEVWYTVTRQPGDNFRVVAGLTKRHVETLKVKAGHDAQANVSTQFGNPVLTTGGAAGPTSRMQSKLLTIWRQLHIEVDRMGPPVGHFATARISGVILPDRRQYTLADIVGGTEADEPGPLDTTGFSEPPMGRFEGGRLVFSNGTSVKIQSNTAFDVFLEASGPALADLPNLNVQVYDDDVIPPGSQPEPETSLIQTSDQEAENLLCQAYVLPIYDGGGDLSANEVDCAFYLNVHTNFDLHSLINNGFQTEGWNEDDFWVGYLQSGWQGNRFVDKDPSDEQTVFGITLAQRRGGTGSVIFEESMRDWIAFNPGKALAGLRAQVYAHELVHQLNVPDGSGGLMGAGDDAGVTPFITGVPLELSGDTRQRIRNLNHPKQRGTQ